MFLHEARDLLKTRGWVENYCYFFHPDIHKINAYFSNHTGSIHIEHNGYLVANCYDNQDLANIETIWRV